VVLYVPLDPAFPKERLAFMIEDANVPVLLDPAKTRRRSARASGKARFAWMPIGKIIASESAANLSSVAGGDNLAYVILTRQALLENQRVRNRASGADKLPCSVRREPGLNAADILLSVTTLSFDIAALRTLPAADRWRSFVIVQPRRFSRRNQLKGV